MSDHRYEAEGPTHVRNMSRHFIKRWQQRVGCSPSLEKVNEILTESMRIRRQMRCMVPRYGGLVPHKILAEYWNHERGIVMLVDEDRGTAVTVITAHNGAGSSLNEPSH